MLAKHLWKTHNLTVVEVSDLHAFAMKMVFFPVVKYIYIVEWQYTNDISFFMLIYPGHNHDPTADSN